jgi:hypothetical protein
MDAPRWNATCDNVLLTDESSVEMDENNERNKQTNCTKEAQTNGKRKKNERCTQTKRMKNANDTKYMLT